MFYKIKYTIVKCILSQFTYPLQHITILKS